MDAGKILTHRLHLLLFDRAGRNVDRFPLDVDDGIKEQRLETECI